jgi:hypothetical protein
MAPEISDSFYQNFSSKVYDGKLTRFAAPLTLNSNVERPQSSRDVLLHLLLLCMRALWRGEAADLEIS